MASKGQKFNRYDVAFRMQVVSEYLKGNRKEENIDYKERYEILKKYQAFLKAQREKK